MIENYLWEFEWCNDIKMDMNHENGYGLYGIDMEMVMVMNIGYMDYGWTKTWFKNESWRVF